MSTVFKQPDFHVRQFFEQHPGDFRRHQVITPGEQMQLRASIGLQCFSSIQLA
ncbi:hypothetical protein D3C76_1851940 [compost metagenome]